MKHPALAPFVKPGRHGRLLALARLLASMLLPLARRCGAHLIRHDFIAQRVACEHGGARGGMALDIRPMVALSDIPWGYPRPRDVVAQRFHRGGYSLAAWHGPELAGFLWYQFGGGHDEEVRARYGLASPHMAWQYDSFVQPRLRTGPTGSCLLDEAHRRLHARGIRWICSRVTPLDGPPPPGAVRLGSATFVRVGRWQCMVSTVAPYAHLSLRARSIPQLRFDIEALEQASRQEAPWYSNRR